MRRHRRLDRLLRTIEMPERGFKVSTELFHFGGGGGSHGPSLASLAPERVVSRNAYKGL